MNSPASFPRNSSLSLGVVSLHETFYLNALISTSHNDFNQNKAMGVAATLNIELNKRKYWMLFSNTLISPNYNPGLGFLIGTNVIEHFVGFDKNFWPKGKLSKWIRLINPGVELDYYFYSNTYTPLSFQNRFVPLRFFLKNRAKFELYITRWDEFIKEEYRPLNILIDTGKYTFYTSLIIIQSDPSKKLNANLEIRLGEFYNGHFLRNKLVLFYSPSPHVSIQYTLDQTNLFEIGKEKKSGQLLLHVPGVRVSLNPKIHASAFYQYNSLERTGKLNVRFEWEYRPLSYIYLVFNNFKDELVRLEEKQMIAKVNFLYQF